jgi:hypothetical protein
MNESFVTVKRKRREICEACEHNQVAPILNFNYCEICKCIIQGKTAIKQQFCPIGKWGKYEKNEE